MQQSSLSKRRPDWSRRWAGAALVCALEGFNWGSRGPALLIPGRDPLADLDRGF